MIHTSRGGSKLPTTRSRGGNQVDEKKGQMYMSTGKKEGRKACVLWCLRENKEDRARKATLLFLFSR
jgi:hypothetical protein